MYQTCGVPYQRKSGSDKQECMQINKKIQLEIFFT